MDTEIRLGVKARDRVSKLEGILTAHFIKLHGMDVWALTPAGDGTTSPEAKVFDSSILEVIDVGISATVPEADESRVAVQLGQEVVDEVSGVKGIAIERAQFMDGCIYFSVQPKVARADADKVPEAVFMAHQRLRRIGDGVVQKVKASKEKEGAKPPGGPTRSMSSIRRI